MEDTEPSVGGNEEENTQGTMFMDIIGEDSLHNVIRLFSSKPNNQAWAQGIVGTQMKKLYSIKGDWHTYVLHYFDEICVRDLFLLDEANKSTIFVNSHSEAFRILRLAGPNMRAIRWEDFVPEKVDIRCRLGLTKKK